MFIGSHLANFQIAVADGSTKLFLNTRRHIYNNNFDFLFIVSSKIRFLSSHFRAVTVFSTPDDGCGDTRNMWSDFAVNKNIPTVASSWIFINIKYA